MNACFRKLLPCVAAMLPALVYSTASHAAPKPVEVPNLRCGGDTGEPLQRELEDRKLAFLQHARAANAKGNNANGAAYVGYFSLSGPPLRPPWPVPVSAQRISAELEPARRLDNDQDMGLNSWVRVLYLNRTNPALSDDERRQITDTLLRFRYWVTEPRLPDDRSEQVFWSENHHAMYSTIELLAGQLMPTARFRDGATGDLHRARAETRLDRWLTDRLHFGFSEWNSPVYYEYEIMPLLNLVDFADNPRISQRAAMVLDILLFDLARFTQRGSFGVTAGRVYGEHKVAGWGQSVGDTIQVLFGTRGRFSGGGGSPSANALATTVKYCVPSVLLAIGQHQPDRFVDRSRVSVDYNDPGAPGVSSDEDGLAWWSRGAYYNGPMRPKTNEMISKWKLPEGLGEDMAWIANLPVPGGHGNDLFSVFFEGMSLTKANLYTYRDAGAMLSSVQRYRVGQMGPQMQPWQISIDNDVSVFGTYPAARDSHNGPNWWTGNAVIPFVVQKESAAIAVYGPHPLGAQALAFGHRTHLWFPSESANWQGDKAADGFWEGSQGKFDAVRFERVHWSNDLDDSVWMFGMKRTPGGEAYVGIYSAQPCQAVTTGTWRGKEVVCEGLRNAFVIQVGSQQTFGSFDRFVDLCRHARIFVGAGIRNPVNPFVDMLVNFDSPDPIMAKNPGGHRLQLDYGSGEVRYGNTPVDLTSFPRFENPYTRTPWGARQYTIAHADLVLKHDVDQSLREGEGLKPRPFDGEFNMIFWSKQLLYGIRPDGALVWYGHLIGDNRNPPEAGVATDLARARETNKYVVEGAAAKATPGAASPSVSASRAQQVISAATAANPPASPVAGVRSSASVISRAAVVAGGASPAPSGGVATPASAARLEQKENTASIVAPAPRLIHQWEGPVVVGTGWQTFRDVIPGGVFTTSPTTAGASVYGVTPDGILKWYRHDGMTYGMPSWKGPVDVGSGWNGFTKIVAMGDGVLYGIGTDGSLRWYRHNDSGNASRTPNWTAPQVVGQNWNRFTRVFSTGEGVLYAVDQQGALWWTRHRGYLDGANVWDEMRQVGSGWGQFKEVFSPGGGLIYAITPEGVLYWYEHLGYQDGKTRWRGPTYIGATNWKEFTHVFPVMWGTPTAPVIR
jgi:hypothetical protein